MSFAIVFKAIFMTNPPDKLGAGHPAHGGPDAVTHSLSQGQSGAGLGVNQHGPGGPMLAKSMTGKSAFPPLGAVLSVTIAL